MQKCEDIEALQKAKEILESAGMRIDERTPLADRTPERYNVPPLTSAPDKIKEIANEFRIVLSGSVPLHKKKKILLSAAEKGNFPAIGMETGNVVIIFDRKSSYDVFKKSQIGDKLMGQIEHSLPPWIDRFDHGFYKLYYLPYQGLEGKIAGGFSILFKKFDSEEIEKMDDYDILALKKRCVEDLIEDFGYYVKKTKEIIAKWEKSYQRAWVKSESIAYADLPWADKQTTIAESNGNLFKSRRLNEAMDRIFEDATEAGAKQKYEEDFTK